MVVNKVLPSSQSMRFQKQDCTVMSSSLHVTWQTSSLMHNMSVEVGLLMLMIDFCKVYVVRFACGLGVTLGFHTWGAPAFARPCPSFAHFQLFMALHPTHLVQCGYHKLVQEIILSMFAGR